MSDVLLQIIWVAAHVGLREWSRERRPTAAQWSHVHDITIELGCPPAPRMGRVWS
jgi:hypothetical protein